MYIGRFIETKGLKYLIKACSLLKNEGYKYKCILIGEGPEKKGLINYIITLGLKNEILLKSFISHSDRFKKNLSSADLFTLPSIIDSKGEADQIPNILLEAMALEILVLTTKVGGMAEVISHGKNGFFVKEKDPVDLAGKIKYVMNLSPEARAEIGKKARETVVKYFDKEKQGKKFIALLKSQIQ